MANQLDLKKRFTEYVNLNRYRVLYKTQIQSLCKDFSFASPRDLMQALLPIVQEFAVAPVSNFHVGAIIYDAVNEQMACGTNIELGMQFLNESVHGEQSAIALALHLGFTISELQISAAPCGHCRQFINELAAAKDLKIIFGGVQTQIANLLPEAFGPAQLQQTGLARLTEQAHFDSSFAGNNEALWAAIAAANKSYAPYSENYSGVAMQFADGRIVAGSTIENVAYNPGLSALHSGIIMSLAQGLSFAQLKKVILVESAHTISSQSGKAQQILPALNPHASLEIFRLES